MSSYFVKKLKNCRLTLNTTFVKITQLENCTMNPWYSRILIPSESPYFIVLTETVDQEYYIISDRHNLNRAFIR